MWWPFFGGVRKEPNKAVQLAAISACAQLLRRLSYVTKCFVSERGEVGVRREELGVRVPGGGGTLLFSCACSLEVAFDKTKVLPDSYRTKVSYHLAYMELEWLQEPKEEPAAV